MSNSFKESKKRKVTKRILKKTLLELAINVKAEVKNCHKASKTFVSSNTSNFSLKKSNFSQLSIFREIGYKELFDTYYKGIFNNINATLRMRAVSKLWSVINYVSEREEYVKDEMKVFNELNNKQTAILNKAQKALLDYIYQLLIQANTFKNNGERNYVIELERARADWMKLENRKHPDIVYEKLVRPIILTNKEYLNLTSHLVLPCVSLVDDMQLSYRNRSNFINSYSILFAISANVYLSNLRRLELITSILYPSHILSLKRMFNCSKLKEAPKKPLSKLEFIPLPK